MLGGSRGRLVVGSRFSKAGVPDTSEVQCGPDTAVGVNPICWREHRYTEKVRRGLDQAVVWRRSQTALNWVFAGAYIVLYLLIYCYLCRLPVKRCSVPG